MSSSFRIFVLALACCLGSLSAMNARCPEVAELIGFGASELDAVDLATAAAEGRLDLPACRDLLTAGVPFRDIIEVFRLGVPLAHYRAAALSTDAVERRADLTGAGDFFYFVQAGARGRDALAAAQDVRHGRLSKTAFHAVIARGYPFGDAADFARFAAYVPTVRAAEYLALRVAGTDHGLTMDILRDEDITAGQVLALIARPMTPMAAYQLAGRLSDGEAP